MHQFHTPAPGGTSDSTNQHGFTLVELAIGLMIIGLLLVGILAGEELIQNSRIVNINRQFNAYESAVTTFRADYDALPGDIRNPTRRIAQCDAAPCNVAGDGNGWIGTITTYIELNEASAKTGEYRNFWLHLAKANLISGVDLNGSTSAPFTWGIELPAGPLPDTGFMAWSASMGAPFGAVESNFFVFIGRDGGMGSLTAKQAALLDRKTDDGYPYRGNLIIAPHSTTYWGCATAADPAATYNTTLGTASCVVARAMRY